MSHLLGEISLFAAKLKRNLKELNFKTYRQMVSYVQRSITNQGYDIAFPVNICPDKVMSNWTPCNSDLEKDLNYRFCTIDLGIQIQGYIVDTAITLVKDVQDQMLLLEYRRLLRIIEEKVDLLCAKGNGVMGHQISNIVDEVFKESKFTIVPYCAAHTIQKYCLHSQTISMVKPGVRGVHLGQGSVFTIEPHVALGPFKLKVVEGTIGKSKDNVYDTIDNRLGRKLSQENWMLYDSIFLDTLCFYEEDTYTIRGNRLINLTKV